MENPRGGDGHVTDTVAPAATGCYAVFDAVPLA